MHSILTPESRSWYAVGVLLQLGLRRTLVLGVGQLQGLATATFPADVPCFVLDAYATGLDRSEAALVLACQRSSCQGPSPFVGGSFCVSFARLVFENLKLKFLFSTASALRCGLQVAVDYRHGTGHGVGAALAVHEIPPYIGQRFEAGFAEASLFWSPEPVLFAVMMLLAVECRKRDRSRQASESATRAKRKAPAQQQASKCTPPDQQSGFRNSFPETETCKLNFSTSWPQDRNLQVNLPH